MGNKRETLCSDSENDSEDDSESVQNKRLYNGASTSDEDEVEGAIPPKLDIADEESELDYNPDEEDCEYPSKEIQFRDDYSDAGTDFDKNTVSRDDIPVGSYWSYLIVNFDKKKKIHTYIGKSRTPMEKCELWNRKDRKSRRSKINLLSDSSSTVLSKPIDGDEEWKIELIIGPFSTKEAASAFKFEWRDKSRGIKPRRERGEYLAKIYDKKVYDARL